MAGLGACEAGGGLVPAIRGPVVPAKAGTHNPGS